MFLGPNPATSEMLRKKKKSIKLIKKTLTKGKQNSSENCKINTSKCIQSVLLILLLAIEIFALTFMCIPMHVYVRVYI